MRYNRRPVNSTSDVIAFRALERALVRRRIHGLELRLRLELAAILVLLTAFAFWRLRVPLDGASRHAGPLATAGIALALLALFAAAGAALTASRMLRALTRRAAGPDWLALPVNPTRLHRHLVWHARGPALLAAFPALACLIALGGLIPVTWIVLLAAVFVGLLLELSRLAAALSFRAASRRAQRDGPGAAHAGVPRLVRVLGAATRDASRPRRPHASFAVRPAWRALMRMDLALTQAHGTPHMRAIVALALAVLSALTWANPWPRPLERVVAFAFALLAAMAAGEWLIEATCRHPFQALRTLPLSLRSVWGSRAAWGVLATAALVVAQGAGARALPPEALRVHLGWVFGATLLVGALGANYAITLFPRADRGRRMLALSLSLAVIASLMIPLMGWVLLLTAVAHSSARLPRWATIEDA
jgi:hypothetical protein